MLASGATVNELAKICSESTDAAQWERFLRLATPYASMTAARVCRIWTGKTDSALIEDIVQEVFVRICDQERKILREFKPRGEDSFFALLRVVSASVANDYFRRHYSLKRGGHAVTLSLEEVQETYSGRQASNAIQSSVLHAQLDQMIRSAPAEISERDRNLFWLYYLHGFTAEELASIEGANLTSKGVESALRRMIQWLKSEIRRRNQSRNLNAPQESAIEIKGIFS
jgi:RNA polymerase sigma-70 factor (ECF subfamily)